MTAGLYRLGQICTRRRWAVFGIWLMLFLGVALWARAAGSEVSDNLTLPGTNSQAATDLLAKHFPTQANGMVPVVMQAPAGRQITDQRYQKPIQQTLAALRKDPDIRSATSPLSSAGSSQVTNDATIGYIALNVRPGASDLSIEDAQRIVDKTQPVRAAGLRGGVGAYVGQKVSKPATHDSEVIGLSMAVIVLLFTFGTVAAMGLPIITAIIGLVIGLSLITALSHVMTVPTVAPTLATMVGLGVGIDYALFIVTRHLEQRREGMDTRESIARATATSGGAVLFAGCTVIVALASMAVVRIPLVTTLGITAGLVVAIAVIAALTLLPAVLAVVGDRIDALPLPIHPAVDDEEPHGWARWGAAVARVPIPAALAAVVVLVLLALPTLDIYLGQKDAGALPTSTQARRAYDAMAVGFGAGSNGPLLVSVRLGGGPAKPDPSLPGKIDKAEKSNKQKAKQTAAKQQQQAVKQYEAAGMPPAQAKSQAQAQVKPALDKQLRKIDQAAGQQRQQAKQPATDPRLQGLRDDLQKTQGVQSVSQPLVNSAGTAAVLNVLPTTAPADEATAALVTRVRDVTVPKATKGNQMSVDVGGTTASYVDLASEISSRLIATIGLVVALSFLLLLLAFRSIVIPLTAALMNLVSIGAAFGVVTAVFEKGWGATGIGLDGPVAIVSFVPLMMFAVLFGLSMDYEVFLMTHVREAWLETGDNRAAVIEGVATTGRVITSAALIMVSVFFAFIINGDPTVKQFGVGMGVAVAVDATVVRCLLVPAVMVMLGRSNWWFPRWLDRLVPNFSIEGEDWFRERDRAAVRAAGQVVADAEAAGEPQHPGRL